MADVTINLTNPFHPDHPALILTVGEDEMIKSPSTKPSGRKRAGDVVPGDTICHGPGAYVVADPE